MDDELLALWTNIDLSSLKTKLVGEVEGLAFVGCCIFVEGHGEVRLGREQARCGGVYQRLGCRPALKAASAHSYEELGS